MLLVELVFVAVMTCRDLLACDHLPGDLLCLDDMRDLHTFIKGFCEEGRTVALSYAYAFCKRVQLYTLIAHVVTSDVKSCSFRRVFKYVILSTCYRPETCCTRSPVVICATCEMETPNHPMPLICI